MSDVCDHTSVGLLVQHEGKTLLIERANKPYGFAMPAGHVDGDTTFEEAARRELFEEVGLTADSLELIIEGRKDTPCKRKGTWHYWKIFRTTFHGDVVRSQEETKKIGWYTPEEIQKLATRTKMYRAGTITENEWEAEPGLEPVMYDWFKQLHLL